MVSINKTDLLNLIKTANDNGLQNSQTAINAINNLSETSIFDMLEQGLSEEEISAMLVQDLDMGSDDESNALVESIESFVSSLFQMFSSEKTDNETDEAANDADESVAEWDLSDTGNLFKAGVTKEDFEKELEDLINNADGNETYLSYLNEIKDGGVENFFNALDANADGVLNEEEINAFVNADNNSNSISKDEWDSVVSAVKENTTLKAAETTETPEVQQAPQQSQSSGGSSGGSYSGGNQTPKVEKNINNMSLEELKTEQGKRATALTESKDALNDVYSGKDSKVASAQESMNASKEAYDKALEEDKQVSDKLKQDKAKNDESIAQNEQAIAQKQTDINNKQSEINAKESEISALDSAITTLEGCLSTLQGQLGSVSSDDEDAAAKTAAINAKIASVEAQIQEKNAEKDQAEQDKKRLDAELLNLSKRLGDLNITKTTLETARQEIESQIAATGNEQTQAALKSYQDSRTQFESVKADRIKEATEALNKAQESYTEVANKITEKENRQLASQNRYNDGELFQEGKDLTWEYQKDENGMPYAVIKPENVNPDEELPVLVLCHGAGEAGNSEGGLKRYYDQMLAKLEEQSFNGYIILPQVGSATGVGSWGEAAGERISGVLDSFSETHNIDADHIAIAGYSAGAHGNALINTANGIDDKYTIVSAGIIASQPTDAEVEALRNAGIQVYGFTGSRDSYGMTTAAKVEDTTIYDGVDHGQGVIAAMSDMGFYEKLFGEYYKY